MKEREREKGERERGHHLDEEAEHSTVRAVAAAATPTTYKLVLYYQKLYISLSLQVMCAYVLFWLSLLGVAQSLNIFFFRN